MTTPALLGPSEIGPINQDPAFQRALALKQAYTDACAAVRWDGTLNDIEKGRRLARLWTQLTRDLNTQYEALMSRVRRRVDSLGEVVPLGPGIPDGVSPADRAVLMTAWNNALNRVRNSTARQGVAATPEETLTRGRNLILDEAMRFDDETTIRAVLTTYMDEGRWDLIENWARAKSADTIKRLQEWRDLTQLLAGSGFDQLWISQAFGHPNSPDEAKQLPAMVAAHNATVDTYNRSQVAAANRSQVHGVRRPTVTYRPLIELTSDELV